MTGVVIDSAGRFGGPAQAPPPIPADGSLNVVELCDTARITERQADYWTRQDLLRTTGWNGTCNTYPPDAEPRYPPSEARVAHLAARLLASGLALDITWRAARAMADSGDTFVEIGDGITLTITDPGTNP